MFCIVAKSNKKNFRFYAIALGFGVSVYLFLQLLNLILIPTVQFLQSFASWYQIYGTGHEMEVAIASLILYVLFAGLLKKHER